MVKKSFFSVRAFMVSSISFVSLWRKERPFMPEIRLMNE